MKTLLWRCAVAALMLVPPAFASACASVSLASYILLGAGGCTINGELVNNFNFSVVSVSGGYVPLDATQINVTPSFTPSSYTLFFSSSGFSVTGSDFVHYEIDFKWDPVVVGAEDDMVSNTPVFPGQASVTTNLCAGSTFGTSCPPPTNSLFVFNDGITSIPTAITTFSPSLIVDTQSFLNLDGNGASSQITGFRTSVFTPEPASLFLVATAFGALLAKASCRRSVRNRSPLG
jgi:hypothetical protein